MESPIIDCDLLEASKENIQPLSKGRRVTALSTVLSTPLPQREAENEPVKKKWRQVVWEALNSQDNEGGKEGKLTPLEAYTQFINWTVEAYPSGPSSHSALLPLLEEATRTLLHHPLPHPSSHPQHPIHSLEYLDLWLLYASYVENPEVVYRFCIANDVGVRWGALYESWAGWLERAARRGEADEVWALAVGRGAEPRERVLGRYREFQKRMLVASSSSPSPVLPTPTTAAPKRSVLSSTTPFLPASLLPPPAPTSTSNKRLQIYVDSSPPTLDISPYPDLGTRKSRIKENVPEVKKAGGSVLKQTRTKPKANGTGKIAVFRDDDNEVAPPHTINGGGETGTGAAASVRAFTSFRDEVHHFPLLFFRLVSNSTLSLQPAPPPSQTSGTASPAPPSAMKPKPKPELAVPSSANAGMGVGVGTGPGMSNEAEALRKDPLKNYTGLACVRGV